MIKNAEVKDISALYDLQLLAFESEAEMIGSREVPALQESREDNEKDFVNWNTLKLLDREGGIIAAIRYRRQEGVVEIGRLMVHPGHRRQGLAQRLMEEVDRRCPGETKELYTCSKSWINLRLYEKLGYRAFKEVKEDSGLSFLYMRK